MINQSVRLPTEDDAHLALASLEAFATLENKEIKLQINSKTVQLPPIAMKLVQRILSEIAAGNAVAITPIQPEITTQEAADLLNVSRPYLIGLLENNTIVHRKIGTHRRVPLKALLEYKSIARVKAEKAMQELADLSQELGLGY